MTRQRGTLTPAPWLRLAFGTPTLLTLALGMIGFSMIEEMHVRTHRIQLRADWQRQLGIARSTLDEEMALSLQGAGRAEPAARAARAVNIERIYQAMRSPARRPGLSARPEDVVAVLNGYRPALDRAEAAHRTYWGDDAQEGALLVEAVSALGALQRVVESDLTATLGESDVTHHQRLIAVMALVGAIAGLGIWTGGRTLQAIGEPLGAHLGGVGRGDFTRRVPTRGRRSCVTSASR